ncbi:MAG: glycosyltransferase family 39 protein [Cyanobacteria bacterium SID2]|nr:glycosyltransferase family 39 protein [Cyanobacteria bacterium SID2]MBP0005461.1 glycosyltransferase family 39 protein [Cyanobacteria bacterium SBC]
MKRAVWWPDVLTLIVAFGILTAGLGGYGLYEPHEGHFAGVAREMVLRGDWITPTLNGAPYLNKPPLVYWSIATSYSLLGIHEFAARLPLAIAAWFGVLVSWKWGRDLATPSTGRVAALMLATACGWFIFVHQVLIDVLLGSLLFASYYFLWRLTGNVRHRKCWISLSISLGLCVLAKGPSMLVFPMLATLAVAGMKSPRRVFKALRLPWGLIVLLFVVLPWTIAVETANPGFLQYFLFNENLQRIADTRFPPDYDVSKIGALGYVGLTWLWSFPWALVLPQTVALVWKEFWRHSTRRGRSYTTALTILAVGTLSPVLLFLPLSSRLVYYGLPSVPPFVLLCALWWTQSRQQGDRWGHQFAGILFTALGASSIAVTFKLPVWMSATYPELISIAISISLSIGLGCLTGGLLLLGKRRYQGFGAIAAGTIVAYVAVTQGFVQFSGDRSSQFLIETAQTRLEETTIWTFEGSKELGAAGAMSYYLDRDGTAFPETTELPTGWVRGKPGLAYPIVFVLTDGGDNRTPPAFPGQPPEYAITGDRLQELWNEDRSVVFVTDFMRQPDDPSDPISRNLPDDAGEPLISVGSRSLYGNATAREVWNRR